MGCWDVFCVICGNTCHGALECGDESDDEYCKIPKEFKSKLKWLNKCTFLTLNNKIIHGVRETACNIDFEKGNSKFQQIGKYYSDTLDVFTGGTDNCGVFLHTDCWKFIKKHYDINLKYGDLPVDRIGLAKIKSYYKVVDINYGPIEKYWSQDFMFDKAYNDKNAFMCESPLKNDKNATRIKRIINLLKIRSDPDRKSPLVSASFYKSKTIKIGNDGNFWIINGNKWLKMLGKIIKKQITIDTKDKKQIKVLNSLMQIGEINTKPIFIESFNLNRKQNLLNLVVIALEQ